MSAEFKIFFTGQVDENGVLKITNRKQFDQEVKEAFKGKRIQGYVTRLKKTRSLDQNAALWGVAYVYLAKGFRDVGNVGFTTQDAHAFCKERFKPSFKEVVIPSSGETVKVPTTTTASTTDLMTYYAQIQDFGKEFLGITIPDPNPLWNIDNPID